VRLECFEKELVLPSIAHFPSKYCNTIITPHYTHSSPCLSLLSKSSQLPLLQP
jgi:hypothetical protein